MRGLLVAAVLALGGACSHNAAPTAPQEIENTIVGTVVDAAGKPAALVKVTLEQKTTFSNVVTNETGAYKFFDVAVGTHAYGPTTVMDTTAEITINEGGQTGRATIVLHPGKNIVPPIKLAPAP